MSPIKNKARMGNKISPQKLSVFPKMAFNKSYVETHIKSDRITDLRDIKDLDLYSSLTFQQRILCVNLNFLAMFETESR